MTSPAYIMVTDFDGTAAEFDVQQVILDALADPEAWRGINREWAAGHMTTAERARAQWALLRGGERDVLRVLDPLRLDPGFHSFVQLCEQRGFPLYVVSDGFDFYIEPLLARAGLSYLPVFANSLRYEDGVAHMSFLLQRSPDQYYGNDKTYVIEQVRQPGSTLVFVGDGNSDRAAAHVADLIFAKDKLAEYCEAERLPFQAYTTFDDISGYFRDR